MTWGDWAGYLRSLATVSCLAALAVYLYKLALPGKFADRLAGIALALGFLAASGALVGGLLWGQTPAWALFAAPLLGLYWLLESEFGTKLLGMIAAFLGLAGEGLFAWHVRLIPHGNTWHILTASGAIVAGAFEFFALATWLLAVLLRVSPVVASRRTGRFFVVNPPIVAELAYRINGWALPFALFSILTAVIAFVTHQLSFAPLGFMGLVAATSFAYAVTSRHKAHLGWLVLASCGILAGFGTLGLSSFGP
ncbi:MAG: hypothetical protein KGR26_04890 [Cyanobacteria bacterium REEB65]|nr:hypothetical protein [Cyanobacteria bacterium REEB65]